MPSRRSSGDTVLALIPLFPFVGFLVNATIGRRLPKAVSGGLASLAMLASFAVVGDAASGSWPALAPGRSAPLEQTVYTWIASGDFTLDLTFRARPAVGGDDPGRSPASAR